MSTEPEQARGYRRRDEGPPESSFKDPAGRIPPHDLDAEAACLSACMLRGVPAVDEVLPLISPEEFYSEAHRRIFEACVDLAQRGQPIDTVQVGTWLKERDRLKQVGGMPYLGQIADAAPVVTGANLRAYATTIRNRSRLRRLAYRLAVAQSRCYSPMPDSETDEFFATIERDIGEICAARHAGDLEIVGPLVTEVMGDFDRHSKDGGGIVGIPTGFDRLDKQMCGLHDGDLTIVAARPGIGKTSLVMNICDNVSERGYAGAVFSLEMPKKQLVAKLLCARGRVNLSKARNGDFGPADWQKLTMASSEIFPRDIYIDDQSDQSLAMIRSKLRRLTTKLARQGKRVGVVIIDYLQLMKRRVSRGETLSSIIGEISRGLKNLAKELSLPILLLCQLNREVEKRDDKRPQTSDLRDSGEIEQDADNIVFIYRDDYYFEESEEPNIAELIIAKQRNGPIGMVKVRFDKQWTRFDNLAAGEFEDGEHARFTVPPGPGPMTSTSRQYLDTTPEPPPSGRFADDDINPLTEGLV